MKTKDSPSGGKIDSFQLPTAACSNSTNFHQSFVSTRVDERRQRTPLFAPYSIIERIYGFLSSPQYLDYPPNRSLLQFSHLDQLPQTFHTERQYCASTESVHHSCPLSVILTRLFERHRRSSALVQLLLAASCRLKKKQSACFR
jgi:hypothetical protein